MKYGIINFFFVLTLLFTGCNSSSTSANIDSSGKNDKAKSVEQIDGIRLSLKESTNNKFAKAEAQRLTVFLLNYADDYPSDSLTPEYIFEAANIYIGLNEYNKAIANFDRVIKHYDNYIKRPEVMYMKAFVYDYHMNQYAKAKEQYELVIEEYPTHIFAEEAKNAIEILGLTDEELIERFKQKNQSAES